ncbi:PIN domain-containing protein [Sphingobium aquiterrae]|uniref:PIN domain-containing protein n=1 Tax=Sphingobium aquiterrae TaxID=2038656 RepID=UPI003017F73A
MPREEGEETEPGKKVGDAVAGPPDPARPAVREVRFGRHSMREVARTGGKAPSVRWRDRRRFSCYDVAMAYDAFTIDTNLAIEGGLNLEGGLLGQLTQFKDGQIDLILSEIVVREVRKHLNLQVKKVRDTLVSLAARAEEVQLTEGDAAAELKAKVEALGDPRDVAGARLKKYFEDTGATTIPVKLASIDALVRGYFSASPPFDATGAKKSEFPDAIALLAIEAWATKSGKKVLAVSKDKGWADFAANCDVIDVEPDFAKALQIVQEHAEEASARVGAILEAVEAGGLPEIAAAIEEGLRRGLPGWPIHGEGGGAFYLELDSAELEFESYTLIKDGDGYDITIVRMGSNQVVARIGAEMKATARADFSLSVWDSIDKEYVGMGGQSAETTIEFDGAFLLTIGGDLAGDPADLEAEEVEIVEAIDEVDFGEIEFDPGDEDYEEWLAEDADADVAVEGQAAIEPPAF